MDFDIFARIEELRIARNWSVYRLARESGITYSTLSSQLKHKNFPTLPTLLKLCSGFGITVGQFFDLDDESVHLCKDQLGCLELWDKLDDKSKMLATTYMKGLIDRQ